MYSVICTVYGQSCFLITRKISHFVKMLTFSKLDKANIPSLGQAILVLFSNSKLYSVAIFPNSCLNTDVFSSSLVVIQKAADYMCQCGLSYITRVAYRDTVQYISY